MSNRIRTALLASLAAGLAAACQSSPPAGATGKLPFELAVDEGGAVAKAFRVPLSGGLAARQTFLIGPDGRIKKVWLKVKPDGHAAEILAAAKS